jgi:hypothetical protein
MKKTQTILALLACGILSFSSLIASADNSISICAAGSVGAQCFTPPDNIDSTILLRRAGTLKRTRVRLREIGSNGLFLVTVTGLKAGNYVARVGNTHGFFHVLRSNGKYGRYKFYREDVEVVSSRFTSSGPTEEISIAVRVSPDRRCEILGRPHGCITPPV